MKKITSFTQLNLPSALAKALEKMKFLVPTPVQAASLPPGLAGIDILGTAQTGTGKTAAFGIPLLAKLSRQPGMKAVVLAPTRELAAQIHQVLLRMSEGTKLKGALLVGGESFLQQKLDVKAGADYFVCTPGRLIDHLTAGLKLTKVGLLVLDEVDRMLDMGFAPQLTEIEPHLPAERQTLLFSATLPKEILAVASQYLRDPVRVSIGATTQPMDRVVQENCPTTHLQKNDLLLKHLKEREGRFLIFARTQHRANRVHQMLERNRIKAVLLHGGRTQNQRKQALDDFRAGGRRAMVATDLAGRGIDIDDIRWVINYDLPVNREDYIHRIGRTARNGREGTALNYLTPEDQGGKGIISPPERKPGPPKAPSQVKAVKESRSAWRKDGWRRAGGRNRPEFQKRAASQGYGHEGQKQEKRQSAKSPTATKKNKRRRLGDTRLRDAARKLGEPVPKPKRGKN